jgi:hypothetical protein
MPFWEHGFGENSKQHPACQMVVRRDSEQLAKMRDGEGWFSRGKGINGKSPVPLSVYSRQNLENFRVLAGHRTPVSGFQLDWRRRQKIRRCREQNGR